jgi:UDP-N-acetylglucosamine 1-carboxyvinyltransferase
MTMDKFVVEGGRPLEGEVDVSGAKNAALPILFASILHPGRSVLENVPELHDIATTVQLLQTLGLKVEHEGTGVQVDAAEIPSCEAPYDQVRKMRAGVLAMGPLLAREGRARVSMPGGCAIGERPIDQHLKGFEAMGAEITLEHGYIEARCKRLKGAQIHFDMTTVGGTENVLMAATLAEGTSVLHNAACEPEVVDLAEGLIRMGARISGVGTPTITVEGVDNLGSLNHVVIPDRIEAGTFLAAAAITRGNVLIRCARLEHLDSVVLKLTAAGVEVRRAGDGIRVQHHGELHSVDMRTAPFPGFPTDMQAQMMALMTVATGRAVITETIFENRFMHVQELRRMGAKISVEGNSAFITGVDQLLGAAVMATDLRASASLLIAALAARGRSEVLRVYHIDRGYARIVDKLRSLGAAIERASA